MENKDTPTPQATDPSSEAGWSDDPPGMQEHDKDRKTIATEEDLERFGLVRDDHSG